MRTHRANDTNLGANLAAEITPRRVRRHLRDSIITLIVAAAVLVPAATATADQTNGLVNIYARDVATDNVTPLLANVTIATAANFCGIQQSTLFAALLQGQEVTCTAATTSTQNSFVTYSGFTFFNSYFFGGSCVNAGNAGRDQGLWLDYRCLDGSWSSNYNLYVQRP
jgi:hypothetical protein